MGAAKLLVFCLATLHVYTTIRKSSQTSLYLEKLQAAENIIYETTPNEAPWKKVKYVKTAKAAKATKHRKYKKREGEYYDKLTNLSDWVKLDKYDYEDPSEPRFIDNFTHFFSHIPKSGAEYAASELLKLLKVTTRLPGNRTEMSIARAQKRFSENVYPEFFEQRRSHMDRNLPIDLSGETEAYTPPLICNMGTTPVSHLKHHYIRGSNKAYENSTKPPRKLRWKCNMWVTEMPWNRHALNVYTIVREPFSHLLSQYFHCTESRDHARSRKMGNGVVLENRQDMMPSLDEWMQTYADLMDENLDAYEMFNRTQELKNKFHCYNPINSESHFVKFVHKLPKKYHYPYPYDAPENRQRTTRLKKVDKKLFEEVKKKYAVVGDTSQMVKTICAIFIKFTQGEHIPEVCECTEIRDGGSDGGEFLVTNLYTNPVGKLPEGSKQGVITMGYNATKHAHGVKNHGSAFVKNLTDHQRDLVGRLRGLDMVLYNVSRAVFDEQIQEMESKYKIKVCDKWNRPKTVPIILERTKKPVATKN